MAEECAMEETVRGGGVEAAMMHQNINEAENKVQGRGGNEVKEADDEDQSEGRTASPSPRMSEEQIQVIGHHQIFSDMDDIDSRAAHIRLHIRPKQAIQSQVDSPRKDCPDMENTETRDQTKAPTYKYLIRNDFFGSTFQTAGRICKSQCGARRVQRMRNSIQTIGDQGGRSIEVEAEQKRRLRGSMDVQDYVEKQ